MKLLTIFVFGVFINRKTHQYTCKSGFSYRRQTRTAIPTSKLLGTPIILSDNFLCDETVSIRHFPIFSRTHKALCYHRIYFNNSIYINKFYQETCQGRAKLHCITRGLNLIQFHDIFS